MKNRNKKPPSGQFQSAIWEPISDKAVLNISDWVSKMPDSELLKYTFATMSNCKYGINELRKRNLPCIGDQVENSTLRGIFYKYINRYFWFMDEDGLVHKMTKVKTCNYNVNYSKTRKKLKNLGYGI